MGGEGYELFRFRNLDVSAAGPIAEKQSLYFSEGLTLVAGDTASGKTSIVRALRREYEVRHVLNPQRKIPAIPSWIIFCDEDIGAPYGGEPWEPLVSLMTARREFLTKPRDFDHYLTTNVRQLLAAKIAGRYSKFATNVSSPGQLHVVLSDTGAVDVTVNEGESIAACFQAMGERTVLFLAINAAVRKLLFLDVPFVMDSQFDILDGSLRQSCYQFVTALAKQVIVIESRHIVESMGLRPNFSLAYDPCIGRSKIEEST